MTEVSVPSPSPTDAGFTYGSTEAGVVSEPRPQALIDSFTTSKGSVYTYDEDGHTIRFKTKTGVEQPKQDITVFIEVGVRDVRTIAAAYLLRSSTEKTRIDVVEQQSDGSLRVVNDSQEITNPDALQVVTFRGDRVVKSKPASLFPKVGLHVFDSRRYEEGGVNKTERHLGHRVTSIKPLDSTIAETTT